MKKKVLFCLAALGAASMLFGFDSAETAESVLEKMQTAGVENPPAAADVNVDMNLDASVDIGDGTTSSSIGIGASGNYDMSINVDPLGMSMDGKLDMSFLGQSQSLIMKLYGVDAGDGTFDTYIYTEDSVSGEEGTWEHGSSDSSILDLEDLLAKGADIDFSEWGLDFELAPEAADVNGTECYLLSAVIDSSSIETFLNKISEVSGEEDLTSDEDVAMAMSMLSGIKVKLEYYVDTTDYQTVKLHIDLNDSDLSAISQYLAMAMGEMAEGSSVELSLNDFSLDTFVTYTDRKEIVVPEEALASAESGDVSGDALGEVENALEDIAG